MREIPIPSDRGKVPRRLRTLALGLLLGALLGMAGRKGRWTRLRDGNIYKHDSE